MKGRIVLTVLVSIVITSYIVGYIVKLDYLKFWPRIILGVTGLSFMIFMHIYSIRKRNKDFFLFKLFSYKLATYLNIHIILATVGVGLIIVHAIGSYDSIVAWVSFFSMFMVWQSGFIGKYIYVRIPKDSSGLILEKMNIMEKLEELNTEFIKSMKSNHENKDFQNFLIDYLSSYSKSLNLLHKKEEYGMSKFIHNFKQTFNAWRLYRQNITHLKKHDFVWSDQSKLINKDEYFLHLNQYEDKMNEILLLHFQIEFIDILKAMFKNWHDIHVPLTYLLYSTAAMHVIVIVLFSSYAH